MDGQEQNTIKPAKILPRFFMVGMIDDTIDEMRRAGQEIEVGEGEGSVIIKLTGCRLINGRIVEVRE